MASRLTQVKSTRQGEFNMTKWHSIDDMLNYAIGEEQAAAEFYT